MDDVLSFDERKLLLTIARQALLEALASTPTRQPVEFNLTPRLMEDGVTFVTLTIGGELRGCVGALEAYQPLFQDVREHALAAAFKDYRFSPLRPDELPSVEIEISRLTSLIPIEYEKPLDLLAIIRPGIDGVLIQDGICRATFLPQVWEKLPDTATFLTHLCQKMGVDPHLWRRKKLAVSIYQVEMFHEAEYIDL
jgi:AmmeMemoRadiSam system protein A